MKGRLSMILAMCGVCLTALIGLQMVLAQTGYEYTPSTTDRGNVQANQQMAGQSQFVQVSKVLNKEVLGKNQEKLGKVEDLAIDSNTGRIRYVVILSGTMMGMGGKLVPIPWDALQAMRTSTTEGHEQCQLTISKEELAKAPSFESGRWPNFNDQRWVASIEQFYRPYVAGRHEGTTR